MSRDALLAADMIARLLRPGVQEGDAEDAALRLAGIQERFASAERQRLDLTDSSIPLVAGDLPPHGWIWLLENLADEDAEIGKQTLDQLYRLYPDPLLRLRIVDAALSHPRTTDRHEKAIARLRGGEHLRLEDLPQSWPQQWLLELIRDGSERTTETPVEDRAQAIAEMSLYLLQAGTESAFAILAGLMREDRPVTVPARNTLREAFRASSEADWRGVPGFDQMR